MRYLAIVAGAAALLAVGLPTAASARGFGAARGHVARGGAVWPGGGGVRGPPGGRRPRHAVLEFLRVANQRSRGSRRVPIPLFQPHVVWGAPRRLGHDALDGP